MIIFPFHAHKRNGKNNNSIYLEFNAKEKENAMNSDK